jgi:hypothetical protein
MAQASRAMIAARKSQNSSSDGGDVRLPLHEMGMINLLKSPQQKQYIRDTDSAEKLQSQGSKTNAKPKNGRQLSQAGGAIVSGGATLKVKNINSHRN